MTGWHNVVRYEHIYRINSTTLHIKAADSGEINLTVHDNEENDTIQIEVRFNKQKVILNTNKNCSQTRNWKTKITGANTAWSFDVLVGTVELRQRDNPVLRFSNCIDGNVTRTNMLSVSFSLTDTATWMFRSNASSSKYP